MGLLFIDFPLMNINFPPNRYQRFRQREWASLNGSDKRIKISEHERLVLAYLRGRSVGGVG
jgi:hypothetical protein